jgi:trans-2,3-dihydro-3-hydroxyanthranilate isomerase
LRGDPAASPIFDVRIFTPARELPFAGHPTLGTADVIRREVLAGSVTSLRLRVPAGVVPVTFRGDLVWMRQLPPVFDDTLAAEPMARTLGIDVAAIDGRHTVQEVSTGMPFLLVPVRDVGALMRCRVDPEAYRRLCEPRGGPGLYVFAPETHEPNRLAARMFAPAHGVTEDPATGSAAGCLGAYLAHHRVLGAADVDVRIAQGQAIGRPSVLHVLARSEATGIVVEVGGRVVPVARGELL